MRHTFPTMGTVASIELPVACAAQLAGVEALFAAVDERFSLYRPNSELSRIAAGELQLADATPPVRASYERSIGWRTATSGWFTPERPDGVLDLNGIVKAEAIEAAGDLLDGLGCPAWSINVGGDILTRTHTEPWITGVADPADPTGLLATVALGPVRRALATSGSAQRGDHIWAGGSLRPAHFVQVSVMADDIITADVLATAIVAGGADLLDEITDRWAVDVLTVDRSGDLLATPGFRAAR